MRCTPTVGPGFEPLRCVVRSFTNIRGGHNYPAIIRHTPRKPLAKVYLQSGEYDIDNVHGSWPLANKEMFAALAFAGYDVKLEFGVHAVHEQLVAAHAACC